MKKAQRFLCSFVSAFVFFLIVTLLAVSEIIPAFSSHIDSFFLKLPKYVEYVLFAVGFLCVFLINLVIFGGEKDYTEKIKEIIDSKKIELLNKYIKTVSNKKFDYKKSLEDAIKQKTLLIQELKKNYSKNTIKYRKIIDEYVRASWMEIENYLNKNSPEALATEDEVVDFLYSVDEIEEEIEELVEEVDENTVEISNVEVLEELSLIEELEGEEEELEELSEEIDDIEELDSVDDVEEIEELEEIEYKDPYPELITALSNKPIYSVSSNKTFISSQNDDFATVDNIFAEDLCIGMEYTKQAASFDENFKFVPEKINFVFTQEKEDIDEVEELIPLLPVDETPSFSMTQFCQEKNVISELLSEFEGAIVESNGIYTISDNLSYSNVTIDPGLKKLVDSILK